MEDSRLKFDTMRYEVKSKEAKLKAQKAETSKEVDDKAVSANAPISPDENPTTEDESPISKDLEDDSKKETSGSAADDAAVVKEDSKANQGDEPTIEDLEENKLLEKLEDEFVSNTTTAVEIMEEITDSSDILGLVKLFQNFQLVYFRQCVQEVEANLKVLNGLEN